MFSAMIIVGGSIPLTIFFPKSLWGKGLRPRGSPAGLSPYVATTYVNRKKLENPSSSPLETLEEYV